MAQISESDLVQSGSRGTAQLSAQAGYMPIPLRHVPACAFRGIQVYVLLRTPGEGEERGRAEFSLFSGGEREFSAEDRAQLMNAGVRCVYIPIVEHVRFREQTESTLAEVVADAGKAIEEKAALVYETSVALINEVLAEADLGAHSKRLEDVSRSVVTLAVRETAAFAHLFSASHHDFYTATHMVNVGTWMVPLAYALGCHDPDELAHVCQAGLLHDIGKVFIEPALLNKTGRLTNADWTQIKLHPVSGYDHLRKFETLHPLIGEVCRQHHERMDGSGYPDRLRSEKIHRVSRMCAVVDSFDAMTALRPFKKRALTVSEAILTLRSETPVKYDAQVVEAWCRLLGGVNDRDALPDGGGATPEGAPAERGERRRYKRFKCNCTARIHKLTPAAHGGWSESEGLTVKVHNVSRFGLGLLSREALPIGAQVRVYMNGARWRGKFIRGQAVRCVSHDDGWYEIGIDAYAAGAEGVATEAVNKAAELPAADAAPAGGVFSDKELQGLSEGQT